MNIFILHTFNINCEVQYEKSMKCMLYKETVCMKSSCNKMSFYTLCHLLHNFMVKWEKEDSIDIKNLYVFVTHCSME